MSRRRAWWVAAPPEASWKVMLLDAPATREEAALAAGARGCVLLGAALHPADLPPPPEIVFIPEAPLPPHPRRARGGKPRKNISRKSRGQ
jgi:hypothetical protein